MYIEVTDIGRRKAIHIRNPEPCLALIDRPSAIHAFVGTRIHDERVVAVNCQAANRATQSLAFIAGNFDMTFPYEVTLQMVHDINSQAPAAICDIDPTMISFNLMVNRDNPPFNDPDIRLAMMLTIDRKAFLDITSEGKGQVGGAMQSPPAGLWGLPSRSRPATLRNIATRRSS